MNKIIYLRKPVTFLFIALALSAQSRSLVAEITLPAVICDNMVLQQKMEVPVWGWAEPGEQVKVKGSWNNSNFDTRANKDGRWMVRLPAAPAGGPYQMTIQGKNTLQIKNILFGEVWICSGQSNMHMSLEPFIPWHNGTLNFKKEISQADYPNIRLFYVTRRLADLHA